MSQNIESLDTRTSSAPRVPLWRNRDYLLLWSGQAVSSIGSNATELAMPLFTLALTHSPFQAGLVGILRIIATLLIGLPAGALIDRWNRRYTMLICDAIRALMLASLPLALWLGQLTLWQLYLVSFCEGMLFVFFSLAQTASLPRVVTREQLATATAQNEVTGGIVTLLGPSLGGLLYGIGQTLPFLVDAISYLASLISLCFIRTPLQGVRATRQRALLLEIREGFLWLWQHTMVRTIAILTGTLIFAYSGMSLVIIVLAQRQHASAFTIGIIFALGGVGSIAGSLLGAPLERRFGFGKTSICLFWLFAILWPLYALMPAPLLLGVILAGFWLLDSIYDVIQTSYRLAQIPDELQGRVASAYRLILSGLFALGQFLAGIFLQQLGILWTIGLFAVCFVALAMGATLNSYLRRVCPLA